MIHTHITWFLTASADGAAADDTQARSHLEEHLDQVMTELVTLTECHEDVHDPNLAADFSTFPDVAVEIELRITGHHEDAGALSVGEASLRTAIHAAGGYTHRWGDRRTGSARYEQQKIELQGA